MTMHIPVRARAVMAFMLVAALMGSRAGAHAGIRRSASEGQVPTTDSRRARTPAATDSGRQIERIVARIQQNYARLRTVDVLIQTKFVDRSVTERRETTTRLSNGATVHLVQAPFSVQRVRFLLRGEELLRKAMGEDGEIWTFRGGIWTQYVPRSKTAWLRFPEQMPGMMPLDPRNIASLEQRSLFVDRLRRDRVLEIGAKRAPGGQPRVVALMEHVFDTGHKERYRCEFDTEHNDLPTRIVFLRDGDGIGIVLDITYQEVIPRQAWFLKQATCKFFGPEMARSPDSEAWRQAVIVESKGKVHVNEPIEADAFELPFPAGTQVRDSTRGVIHGRNENRPR
jgi:hypothetical protein